MIDRLESEKNMIKYTLQLKLKTQGTYKKHTSVYLFGNRPESKVVRY